MSDRPLGIADLINAWAGTGAPIETDHWYWCRRHSPITGKPHKVGEPCGPCGGCVDAHPGPDNSWPDGPPFFDDECQTHGQHIDVGPFMSEREAVRLDREFPHNQIRRLGMEIER